MSIDTSFLPDLPKGPLCEYRSRAKFDWKLLKLVFEEADTLKTKYRVWKILEQDPLFAHSKKKLSTDEQKRLAAMQMNRMAKLDIVPKDVFERGLIERHKFLSSVNEALHGYSPSLSVKIALGQGLFNNALVAMGTEKHQKYYNAAWNREVIAALAITEVSHGSNTKSIRTTAVYDPKTGEFELHTPDFEAAKCWVGNLGKTATIALTFANLYTDDGKNHGLHGFIVPIRDPKTLLPYRGVLVGDIGEKIGLNGIDNGYVMFSRYRISKDSLLNRTGDIGEDGAYESVFSEPGKVLGAALESFSAGRIGIMQESVNTLAKAAVIAVRYAAVRKQFGPERKGAEVAIIEYQLHQWRIFPYLAAACVLRVGAFQLFEAYMNAIDRSQKDSNSFELLTQLVSELHALISSSKPLITWTARDAIQETREACGGHGYLKASRIGDLRNDHDPSCTYEGDNNVLAQQASNWLVRQWVKVESPVGSVHFLLRKEEISKLTFTALAKRLSFDDMELALECYEWLLCYLMQKTSEEMKRAKVLGANGFEARNSSQVYAARDLSKAYPEYYALLKYKERCSRADCQGNLKATLKKIYLIYAYWSLDKHITSFYQGHFATDSSFADGIRGALLAYCAAIKDDSVAIADALAPPDFALNSVIAKSDGLLYTNLQNEFLTNDGALERPSWWQDVVIQNVKSKL